MTKLLEHSWISAPVGVVIFLAYTVLFWETPNAPLPEKLGNVLHRTGPSWNFNNPEADQLIAELKTEKKSLEKREQQLDELAARLKAERAELGQVTQSVRQLQGEFDKSVLRVKDEEVVNLKKLAKVYAGMSPETAASVLSEMDNEAIVRILLFLKENETAAILEALAKKGQAEARRTATLSEQVRLSTHSNTTK
jgi:flagellar motility protein MotE (MotC chaperone)